jgi:hypothetical protein
MRRWGAGECGFARTVMVTHRTFGNDELDIWEEGIRKTLKKKFLGSAGLEAWLGSN